MHAIAQYPELLMIMRHGEKPGDPSGHNLSTMGSARAAALPSLFTPNASTTSGSVMTELTCDLTVGSRTRFGGAYGSTQTKAVPPRFRTPEFLFATQQKTDKKPDPLDASDDHSNRPVETITPLAQALQLFGNSKIRINDSFGNSAHGIKGITSEILGKPGVYGGHVVLICWHHGTIPELTEAFGVPASELPWRKWPPTIFDLIFCITWPGKQARLDVEYQQLLYGDTAAAVTVA
jgi:hypothetical protein